MRDLMRGLARPTLRLLGRDDRGAVGVLVAILMGGGVLLGMGAVVVDVGQLYSERAQLQNGADAGARAVAARPAPARSTTARRPRRPPRTTSTCTRPRGRRAARPCCRRPSPALCSGTPTTTARRCSPARRPRGGRRSPRAASP